MLDILKGHVFPIFPPSLRENVGVEWEVQKCTVYSKTVRWEYPKLITHY